MRPSKVTVRLSALVLCLFMAFLVASCGAQATTSSTPSLPTTSSSSTQPNGTTTAANTTTTASTTTSTTVANTTAANTTTQANTTTTVATTQAAATTAASAVPSGEFQNPIITTDFPDPYILKVGTVFYAYATNAGGKKIQVAHSSDLVNWNTPGEALTQFPSWAVPDSTTVWAPEVTQIGSKFVMYFTARDSVSYKQCVAVAVGTQPDLFTPQGDQPLVCHPNQGGDIDQDVFRDSNGKLYLFYKNDGNCCGLPTNIFVQPLTADGLSVTGQPIKLITNNQVWEGRVIEAPSMFLHDNKYYLFFSGGNYADATYAVGYATCQSVTGPCQQATENPILKSPLNTNPPVIGPGHQALLQLGTQTWIFYHAWDVGPDGGRGDIRQLYMDKLNWVNGKPQVQGPTTKSQPDPVINP